jgi:hypothetical protein
MTNQRLVLIETTYGEGILFSQEDSVIAYKLLCRATPVRTGTFITPKGGEDIEIKLIAPSRFLPAEPERPMTRQEIIDAVAPPTPAEMPAMPVVDHPPKIEEPSIEF